MRAAFALLALAFPGTALWAGDQGRPQAPSYSPASIVNAASNVAGPLAPNTIATIYGAGLAYTTRAVTAEEVRDGMLPTILRGTGVRVLISGIPAPIYFVSPAQINLVIPANLVPGEARLEVFLDGVRGPEVPILLGAASPGLFQLDRETVIATRADFSLITREAPARPGDIVVLFAAGLGQTVPRQASGEAPRAAAFIERMADLRVLLDGAPVDSGDVFYAGVAPGFPGLYQVNLRLPANLAPNPEIRLALGDAVSPPSLRLPVR